MQDSLARRYPSPKVIGLNTRRKRRRVPVGGIVLSMLVIGMAVVGFNELTGNGIIPTVSVNLEPVSFVKPEPPVILPAEAKKNLPSGMQLEAQDTINQSAQQWSLDPLLIDAVISEESNWRPFAQSGAGAIGLMQVEPATGAAVARMAFGMQQFNPSLLEDPGWNIRIGTAYLGMLIHTNTTVQGALSAYNSGSSLNALGYANAVMAKYTKLGQERATLNIVTHNPDS